MPRAARTASSNQAEHHWRRMSVKTRRLTMALALVSLLDQQCIERAGRDLDRVRRYSVVAAGLIVSSSYFAASLLVASCTRVQEATPGVQFGPGGKLVIQ